MTKPKHITHDELVERVWRLERIVYALGMDAVFENNQCEAAKYNRNLGADVKNVGESLKDDGELPEPG